MMEAPTFYQEQITICTGVKHPWEVRLIEERMIRENKGSLDKLGPKEFDTLAKECRDVLRLEDAAWHKNKVRHLPFA